MEWLLLLINVVVTGLLLYVFQKTIDERAAKRLERFKAELQSTAFEQETKFERLHGRRAEAIVELYKKLHQVLNDLDFGIVEPELEMEGKRVLDPLEALSEFNDYYQEHRILLPKDLCVQIDAFYGQSLIARLRTLSLESSKGLTSLLDAKSDPDSRARLLELYKSVFAKREKIVLLYGEN